MDINCYWLVPLIHTYTLAYIHTYAYKHTYTLADSYASIIAGSRMLPMLLASAPKPYIHTHMYPY